MTTYSPKNSASPAKWESNAKQQYQTATGNLSSKTQHELQAMVRNIAQNSSAYRIKPQKKSWFTSPQWWATGAVSFALMMGFAWHIARPVPELPTNVQPIVATQTNKVPTQAPPLLDETPELLEETPELYVWLATEESYFGQE